MIFDGSDGNGGNSTILTVANDGILNLANLTITKGERGITVNGGILNVAGASFLDNFQEASGGGAIYNSGGTVNIAGSLFIRQ
ncbi:MAG: hypothetical protein HC822_22350 [Oscillochloris sp.]|nr:hypothetical protein [Oscillochloris sp.]